MTKEERLEAVLSLVREECLKAVAKHGPIRSPHEGLGVIDEEFHELKLEIYRDCGTDSSGFKEAIQVAAMGVRYVMDLKESFK